MDPNTISRELKLDHYACGMAGKQKTSPTGTPIPGIWELSWWNHIFEYEGDHDFFYEIERLLAQFTPYRDFLRKISEEGGHAEIYLQLPGTVSQGSSAKPSVLRLMADLGLELGVEVFSESERVRGDTAPTIESKAKKHH